MKRILLTGGSGFVGRNLIEYIEKAGICDFQIDAPSSKELNVLDEAAVLEWLDKGRYDIVLHFAVYTDAVDKTKDGSKMYEYNLKSFENFAKYSDLYGRMFYSGSGAEFDKRHDIVNAKECEVGFIAGGDRVYTKPEDPYGLMKYTIGERIEANEKFVNVRIFGLFGKYEYPGRFITEMCHKALKEEVFAVRQNVYFDYLYIDDFCKMLVMLIRKDSLKYHSYNMVSGQRISLLELCKLVNDAAETSLVAKRPRQEITVATDGLNKEYTASNERFMEEFPDYKYIPIDEAVKSLYDYYGSCVKNT